MKGVDVYSDGKIIELNADYYEGTRRVRFRKGQIDILIEEGVDTRIVLSNGFEFTCRAGFDDLSTYV